MQLRQRHAGHLSERNQTLTSPPVRYFTVITGCTKRQNLTGSNVVTGIGWNGNGNEFKGMETVKLFPFPSIVTTTFHAVPAH